MVGTAPEDLGDFCYTVMREMGAAIGNMHDSGVVHGDLTTSNIMIRKTDNSAAQPQQDQQNSSIFTHTDTFQIVLIDFGLGMTQPSIEDRAVDLYVLERAFLSTHPGSDGLVSAALCFAFLEENFPLQVAWSQYKLWGCISDVRLGEGLSYSIQHKTEEYL